MSKPFKLLISGGGITGPVLAYWLARATTPARPIHITIIERAPGIPKSGQGIDVEDSAREIAQRMGLMQSIKARTTGEQGFACIDSYNRPYATFVAGGMTRELEIMRGDLCEVLMEAAGREAPDMKVLYDRKITKVVQEGGKVSVTIEAARKDASKVHGNSNSNDRTSYWEEYDALIAADGVRSKTRSLIFDPAATAACIDSKPMHTAFFSIPTQPQDAPYSRFQHALRGRSLIIRPVNETFSSVYLIAVGSHPVLDTALGARDQKVKRQAWADAFADVTYGEFPRALREMQTTENFYSDQIAQVKLPAWSEGRCAVVGDAAYCASPITGEGTNLAFLGAYILAGELSRSLDDPAAGFRKYEEKLRGYVERAQQVPLGGKAPAIFNPQTWLGVWLLQTAMWIVAWSKVWKLGSGSDTEKFQLPDYDFGHGTSTKEAAEL